MRTTSSQADAAPTAIEEGTITYLVDKHLRELAETIRKFAEVGEDLEDEHTAGEC